MMRKRLSPLMLRGLKETEAIEQKNIDFVLGNCDSVSNDFNTSDRGRCSLLRYSFFKPCHELFQAKKMDLRWSVLILSQYTIL